MSLWEILFPVSDILFLLQQTSLQQYIVVIYCFALQDIVATKSRTDISMIYRFNFRQSMRCFADISAINRENKARYSSIIVCITFAQYCRYACVSA